MAVYALQGCHNCQYHGLYSIGSALGAAEQVVKLPKDCPLADEFKGIVGGSAKIFDTIRAHKTKPPQEILKAFGIKFSEKDIARYSPVVDCYLHTWVNDENWSESEYNKKYGSKPLKKYLLYGGIGLGGLLTVGMLFWGLKKKR